MKVKVRFRSQILLLLATFLFTAVSFGVLSGSVSVFHYSGRSEALFL